VPSINPRSDECRPCDVWPLGTLQYSATLAQGKLRKSTGWGFPHPRRMLVRIIMAGNLSAFVYISRSVWESWLCVSAFVQGKHLFASTFLVFFPPPNSRKKQIGTGFAHMPPFAKPKTQNRIRKPQMIAAVVRDFRFD